jgi:uncharacterized coiled-coil protein SlyX
MKKLLVASLAALVLALAFSPGAEAKCSVTCLNNKVKGLANALIKAQKTIAAQGQAITELSRKATAQEQKVAGQGQAISGQGGAINAQAQAIKQVNSTLGCLFEAPLTEYGEPEGPFGYVFQFENEAEELETIPTTALDVTYPEDPVGGWALFDGCNTTNTASAVSSSAIAPARSLRTQNRTQTPLP